MFYTNCSTDEKVQIVGPFDDIISASDYGVCWSIVNNHEPRWHLLKTNGEFVVEQLTPHEALSLMPDVAARYNRRE